MDLNNLALFKMAKTKLDYVAERQSVLAQNIANADTPNYKAQDVKRPDFKKLAKAYSQPVVRQAVTEPGHVQAAVANEGPFQVETPRHTVETSLNGNKVVLEDQIEKMSRGRSEYKLALNLIKKNLSMLKIAIGKSGT